MTFLTEGSKVTYINGRTKEHGIIKSFPDTRPSHAYVVFSCNMDWENYKQYTAQHTLIKFLKPGWI